MVISAVQLPRDWMAVVYVFRILDLENASFATTSFASSQRSNTILKKMCGDED